MSTVQRTLDAPAPARRRRPKASMRLVGQMGVDNLLPDLPLLDLAADAGVELVIRLNLPATTGGGVYFPTGYMQAHISDGAGAVITLNPDVMTRPIEEVFAHEVAHHLDCLWGDYSPEHREDFAEYMVPLLLEARPATWREAWPLIRKARMRSRHVAPARAQHLARDLRESGRFDLPALARLSGYSYNHVWAVLTGVRTGSVTCVETLRQAAEQIPAGSVYDARSYGRSARREAAELARVLKRTGRYNVSEIARRTGRPRRTVTRALNGGPCSVYLVEELSLAAGVDLAYLY